MVEHVFFDLDHTLWDFEQNSSICLDKIYREKLEIQAFDFESFNEVFRLTNRKLWRELEQNLISHEELRRQRFKQTILTLGGNCDDQQSLDLNEQFMQLLPQQTHLISHAKEILNYLKPKYHLHILSNGFKDIQISKMTRSGILSYFSAIITSDLADSKKPHKQIFDFALNYTQATVKNSIFIGDDEIADKEGAKNAGIRFIHFDTNHQHPKLSTEISCLSQLKFLL